MTHTESTPYQVRLKILELAQNILYTKYEKIEREATFKTEKAGTNFLTIPKYGVEEVIAVAQALKEFVDAK